jgi:hypothetical protein
MELPRHSERVPPFLSPVGASSSAMNLYEESRKEQRLGDGFNFFGTILAPRTKIVLSRRSIRDSGFRERRRARAQMGK